jgi:hypothetical protein
MTMSQKAQQNQDLKHAPTIKQKKQEEPIIVLSPDDDVGIKSDNTGRPGGPEN